MNKKVEELVEWVATNLYESHHSRIYTTFAELKHNYKGSAEAVRWQARQILSHPDLALIDRSLYRCPECGQGNAIPLAEALKEEVENGSYRENHTL